MARAMILDPLLMLCDEPTGNLDHASAEIVAALLLEMNRRRQSILSAEHMRVQMELLPELARHVGDVRNRRRARANA